MNTSNSIKTLTAGIALASLAPIAVAAGAEDAAMIEQGRYIAKVNACNDCHTAGYAESGGTLPESGWLTGDRLGWRGPWGTTYPVNLRRYMAELSEELWIERARSLQTRPPLPWYMVRDMRELDLRAFYRFVRTLGPVGEPAPAFVPPDRTPEGPVVSFPMPPAGAVAAK
jgi:hypothetical protein